MCDVMMKCFCQSFVEIIRFQASLVNSRAGSWSEAPTYAAEMLAGRLGVVCKTHRDGPKICNAIVNDGCKVDPGLWIPKDYDGIEYPTWAPFRKRCA